jgi:peptide chain release factor 1
MFEKLEIMRKEFEDIEHKLSDPELSQDRVQFVSLSRRRSVLLPLLDIYARYKKYETQKKEAEALLYDPEMKELAQDDLDEAKEALENLYEELRIALLPQDPHDNKNIIVEVRQAAGGEEAALFALELFRAYTKFAEHKRFSVSVLSFQESDSGGLKEGSLEIKGEGAYSVFKYESGVHRVQRVPVTESQGRVHTSTCTVAVMPEAEDFDIEIKTEDLKIDTYRAQGAGGQHVNTTDSAIRITHIPTGTVVTCQDERSQHKNKDRALKILRSRLYQEEEEKRQRESSDNRASQVGTGDRSEKIRTYNFPQDRVTDHRVKISWSNIPAIMSGEMNDIVEKITMEDQARKLANIDKIV